jgi:hypothetical protein
MCSITKLFDDISRLERTQDQAAFQAGVCKILKVVVTALSDTDAFASHQMEEHRTATTRMAAASAKKNEKAIMSRTIPTGLSPNLMRLMTEKQDYDPYKNYNESDD